MAEPGISPNIDITGKPGENSAAARPAGAGGKPGWAAAMAVLLALLIAGTAVAAFFLLQVRGADAVSSRRQAVVAVARRAVADLTTADYRHPQRYAGRLRGEATGRFLNLFTNSAGGFTSVLRQGRVQTAGHAAAVGVQQLSPTAAQLSVLARVTVRNSQTPAGGLRTYRLHVSLILAGSRWLVSNVEFVK